MGGGPVFLYTTVTDNTLGAQKWGTGSTAVLLKQANGWTYGTPTNHIESFAGTGSRQAISATFQNNRFNKTTLVL